MSDSNIGGEASILEERRRKLEELREANIAYVNNFIPSKKAKDLHDSYGHHSKEELEEKKITNLSIAGRIVLKRVMGNASFVTIRDSSGDIQAYISKNNVDPDLYKNFKSWDLGDIIGISGNLFKTKTEELTVEAHAISLITKSLRPMPEKHKGLADIEIKYRQRYLDLMSNPESQEVFRKRSQIVSSIRSSMLEDGFLEVETPMMHSIPGGAVAKPFITHHNALDRELFLRIAPELHLKRLLVGGFEKVFEINRSFRNEGLSTRHNPEFTMLEFYWAYADYHDVMDLTEDMLRGLTQTVLGSTSVTYQGSTYDFSQPFHRISVFDSILHYNSDISASQLGDETGAREIARGLGIELKSSWGLGKVQIEIFEKTVEHLLDQPTFITDYPTEVSPLARRNDDDPFVTDRFEFFVGGREIANGFSELNDAEDQAARFREQVADKDAGDLEAMHYDDDYIRALEHGMPPTAGEGIGIDRLVMLFTDSPSIRDVLLFPHMRPEA